VDTKFSLMKTLRNSVQLIGNIGKDINFMTLENGGSLAKFSMATNEYYKNAKGEKVKETQWHNIVSWGKTAEYINENLKKGNEVMVHGKLKYSSYDDKEGVTRYTCDVVVNEFIKITRDTSQETTPF